MNKNTAISWTGGKDSALAYALLSQQGYNIKLLVTFIPANAKAFLAHPIEQIQYQAQQMNLPLLQYKIREAFAKIDYIAALKDLKINHNIAHIATGDIDYIAQMPNWMSECAELAGIGCLLPLWQKPRLEVFALLFKHQIKFRVSYVNSSVIQSWLGKEITLENLADFIAICGAHSLDICGENGEYHTMVFTAPFFGRKFSVTVGNLSIK